MIYPPQLSRSGSADLRPKPETIHGESFFDGGIPVSYNFTESNVKQHKRLQISADGASLYAGLR